MIENPFIARRRVVASLCAFGLALGLAGPLGAAGPVLLRLERGPQDVVALDLAAMDALPQQGFVTRTQWTEGAIAFSGPALSDVLDLAPDGRQEGDSIRLVAANQYEVVLDPGLLTPQTPIVATRMNGKTFGRRDKGPLWVVFPYDLGPDFQTEGTYAASIWQLIEIRIDR